LKNIVIITINTKILFKQSIFYYAYLFKFYKTDFGTRKDTCDKQKYYKILKRHQHIDIGLHVFANDKNSSYLQHHCTSCQPFNYSITRTI